MKRQTRQDTISSLSAFSYFSLNPLARWRRGILIPTPPHLLVFMSSFHCFISVSPPGHAILADIPASKIITSKVCLCCLQNQPLPQLFYCVESSVHHCSWLYVTETAFVSVPTCKPTNILFHFQSLSGSVLWSPCIAVPEFLSKMYFVWWCVLTLI